MQLAPEAHTALVAALEKAFPLLDDEEAKAAIQRSMRENLLQVAGMQRYAASRELGYFELLINRLSTPEDS